MGRDSLIQGDQIIEKRLADMTVKSVANEDMKLLTLNCTIIETCFFPVASGS